MKDEELLTLLASRRMSRRQLLEAAGKLGLGAAALGPLMAACGTGGTTTPTATETPGAGQTEEPTATAEEQTTPAASMQTERQKTLVVAAAREGSTIDPAVYWQADLTTVMAGLYEPLVESIWHEEEASFEVVPALAESWEISPDNKEYTFKLRSGVTFHDGEPYNAEAQKFAFERAMGINEGPAYMLVDYIEGIDALDDTTLKIRLKEGIATYLQFLAGFWYPGKAVSPKAVKEHATAEDEWAKEWFHGNGVGTGPYKFEEWVPNQQYVLSRYDGYWQGWDGNHMDKIIHRIIPETSTMRLLLEKGDIDAILEPMAPEDFKALEGKSGIVTKKTPSILINVIQIHTQREPTSNLDVRRGLVAAFDYDAAINNIYGGLAMRNGTTFPQGWEGFRDDLDLPKKDLEKAKQHFADAGFASGLELELIYIEGGDMFRRIAEMFQSDLASIGVKLNVKPVSLSLIFEQENSADTAAQMVMIPWGPDNTDSFSIANILWNSKFPPGGINWSLYKNTRVDEILGQVQFEANTEKRVKMWEELDQIIRDDAAWINIAQVVNGNAFRDDIKGSAPSMAREWSLMPYDVYRG